VPTIPRLTDPTSLDPSKRATVRIVIAVPDAPPVDVYAGASIISTRLGFGRLTAAQPLTPTEHLIRVLPTGDAGAVPLFEETLPFSEGQSTLLAFIGTPAGFVLKRIDEDLSPLPGGFARMLVAYLAPDNAQTVPIEIAAGGTTFGPLTVPGDQSDPLPIQAATYELRIRRGDQDIRQNLVLQAHRAYTYLVVWQAEGKLQVIRNVTPTIREGLLRIVHASRELPAYDVYLNDQLAERDLAFREATPWTALPPRNYDVSVRLAGASPDSPAVLRRQFTLNADTAINVIISNGTNPEAGRTAGATPEIGLFAQDLRATLQERARISFVHLARIDRDIFVQSGGTTYAGLDAIRPNAISPAVDVLPGTVQLGFLAAVPEGERTIEFPAAFDLKVGYSYLYVITGNQADSVPALFGSEVGVLDAPAVTPTPVPASVMRLRLINALAVNQPLSVYLNDDLVIAAVQNATSSDYVPVTVLGRTLRLTQAGSAQSLAERDLLYEANTYVTLVAVGTPERPTLTLLPDGTPTSVDAVLRVIHALPGGPRLTVLFTPLVGLQATPTLDTLFPLITFGLGSDAKSMRQGRYALLIRGADDRTEVARIDSIELKPTLQYDVVLVPPADGDASGASAARVVIISAAR
jgi:hypothetical protein